MEFHASMIKKLTLPSPESKGYAALQNDQPYFVSESPAVLAKNWDKFCHTAMVKIIREIFMTSA